MLHFFYFLIFYLLIFLVGRSLTALCYRYILDKNCKDSQKAFNRPIYYFYTLLGLFFIGNISVINNFFFKNNIFYLKVIFLLLVLFNLTERIQIRINLLNTLNFLLIPIIISMSTLTIGLAYDAGLYQLNSQLWIRESSIPLGLYNLHFRYGFSSIIEYISSNFWLENSFEILHFVNISFIASFLGFLSYNLLKNKEPFLSFSSLAIFIFGILDNFGAGGGRNGFIDIESITKQDTPFGILFYLSNILIIFALLKKGIDTSEVLFISLLLLFSIQMRIFGITTLVLFCYMLFALKKITLKTLKILLPSIVLGIFWGLKNLLISGCLLFPVELSCFNSISWYQKGSANFEMQELKNFHLGYDLGTSLSEWFSLWIIKDININTLVNFLFSLIFIWIFFTLFTKKREMVFVKLNIILGIYMFLIIYVWASTSPGIRLGIGIFLLFIGIITLNINDWKSEKFNNKFIGITILITCTVFIPRLDNYKEFINNPLIYNSISPPQVDYVQKLGYGVLPTNGSQCWVNLECVQNSKEIVKSSIYSYKLFEIKK